MVETVVVESPTNGWLIVSAVVQGLAAGAIAVLTVFLVRFTGRYVKEMARANELQSQANAISSALLSRQTAIQTPFLVATLGGGGGSRGGAGSYGIQVQNRGGSLAHDVVVETSWGPVEVASLAPGDPQVLAGNVTLDPWNEERPEIQKFRFRDPNAVEWVQSPNETPERVESVAVD
jgi:hypothetical protein